MSNPSPHRVAIFDPILRALFPVQVLGFPGAYDENLTDERLVYQTFTFGGVKDEWDECELTAQIVSLFREELLRGNNVLVWRSQPKYQDDRVSFRCAFTRADKIGALKTE